MSTGSLLVRTSDNVLDEEDWGVSRVRVKLGQITGVTVERPGCYQVAALEPGHTLTRIADWTTYDPTGSHPECYNEVQLGGKWVSFATPEQIERELDEPAPRVIELTKAQVDDKAHEQFNPERHDFRWHDDGSCTVVRLLWWNDASYIEHEYGDAGGD